MDVSILRMLGGMVVQQVGRLMDARPDVQDEFLV